MAISSDLEASILATVLLKRLGVRRIIAKAGTDLHGSILSQVGATRVVFPERRNRPAGGAQLRRAWRARLPGRGPGYGVARVPVVGPFVGKTLGELDLRTSGVTVVAVRRGDTVTVNPHASEALRSGDELIVLGLDEDLERLPGAATD